MSASLRDNSPAELRSELSRGNLSEETAARIAKQAVLLALNASNADSLHEAVGVLAEMTGSGASPLQEVATTILFRELIEPLNDSFDASRADIADAVMAQLIQAHRASVPGLGQAGLQTETEILAQRSRACHRIPEPGLNRVKTIIVLSRITVGADVAVTSVILSHVKQTFPTQEIVLVGPRKLKELFGADPRLRFFEVEYPRTALLTDRLLVWISVQEAIGKVTRLLEADEYFVVDPDSRLTQLGLLPPIAQESGYLLFDSRRAFGESSKSLAEIAREWCAERWPLEARFTAFPYVAPMTNAALEDLKAVLSARGARRLIFISLGVGGNERKRLACELESELIGRLAEQAALVIDCGASEAERAQVKKIADGLARKGRRILAASEDSIDKATGERCDVLLWDGGIGSFAQLVSICDAYVGYDSAGQHIAAALGRPVLTLFAQGESPRFAQRWRATGRGPARTLLFDAHEDHSSFELVDRAMSLYAEVIAEQPAGY